MRPYTRFALVACLAATTAGCGSRTVPADTPRPAEPAPSASLAAADCALISEAGEAIANVALSGPVDPGRAPHPSNDGERLIFRQLYETLVRLDCDGHVRPGLAAAWRPNAEGRAWLVTMREGARFSDGTPVTTTDVVASWTRGGAGAELSPHVSRYVQSVVPLDDRMLAITLRGERGDAPLVLADTALAIAKQLPGSPWPLGTRGVRVAPDTMTPDASGGFVLTLAGPTGESSSFATSDSAWSLRVLVDPDRDPRDFLDEGVDLVLTRNPAALDYAATLPQFQAMPLPWHRTHVFVSPWRDRWLPPLSAEARQVLADEAVRGEARGAEGPFWWQGLPDCELATPRRREPALPPTGRIVYERGDEASRDLAERLVGLTSAPGVGAAAILQALLPGPPHQFFQRAVGLTGEALASAQARGADAGYILPLDGRPLDACRASRAVADRLEWLDLDTIVPLVDTRLQAIVRRERSGVTVEWDGGLLITSGSGR